jgi:hypothetical protein
MIHAGGKVQCPWRNLSKKKAKAAPVMKKTLDFAPTTFEKVLEGNLA